MGVGPRVLNRGAGSTVAETARKSHPPRVIEASALMGLWGTTGAGAVPRIADGPASTTTRQHGVPVSRTGFSASRPWQWGQAGPAWAIPSVHTKRGTALTGSGESAAAIMSHTAATRAAGV